MQSEALCTAQDNKTALEEGLATMLPYAQAQQQQHMKPEKKIVVEKPVERVEDECKLFMRRTIYLSP